MMRVFQLGRIFLAYMSDAIVTERWWNDLIAIFAAFALVLRSVQMALVLSLLASFVLAFRYGLSKCLRWAIRNPKRQDRIKRDKKEKEKEGNEKETKGEE